MKSLTLIEWILYTICSMLILIGSVMFITYMSQRNEIYMDIIDCTNGDRSEAVYNDCFNEVKRSRAHVNLHK